MMLDYCQIILANSASSERDSKYCRLD